MKSGEAHIRQLKKDLGLRLKEDIETIISEHIDKVPHLDKLLISLLETQQEADLVDRVL